MMEFWNLDDAGPFRRQTEKLKEKKNIFGRYGRQIVDQNFKNQYEVWAAKSLAKS